MKASKRKWIERFVKRYGWDRQAADRAYRDSRLRRFINKYMLKALMTNENFS